jgi:hypothetical protein
VVDVEQRTLRALEEDGLPGGHRLRQQDGDVAHHRPQAFGVRQQLRQHRPPVHGAVLHEAVAGGDVVVDVLLEPLRIVEIADADAAARDLVLVRRPDAARVVPILRSPRRASDSRSRSRWYGGYRCALVADQDAAGDRPMPFFVNSSISAKAPADR